MDLSITQVPYWLSILFVISFITIPICLIVDAVNKAELNSGGEIKKSTSKKIFLFIWSFFALVAIASLLGFFKVNVLPPRIIMFAVLPLLFFYLIILQKTKWFKKIYAFINLEQLVFIHVFRFVGVFFFLVYAYDALPKEFAFIGGGGDILTAALAIPVAIALRKKLRYAKSMVWIWNIIGLLDILSVITSAVIITRHAIANGEAGVQQFGTFPFSWIPAFAPATIIFLHILVFKKLRGNRIEMSDVRYEA